MIPVDSIPRPEHPRPDFIRKTFANLNGLWQFSFDDDDVGMTKAWYRPSVSFPLQIKVPFCYQCRESGIGPTDDIHPVIWYRRSFVIPSEMKGQRILLRFGAVDFAARVFINGQAVGSHVGGYAPFAIDITHALCDGDNDLCVRVEDYSDCSQPRGKQFWDKGLFGCWYTPISGIWQTVYLEAVGTYAVDAIRLTPDLDSHTVTADITLNNTPRHAMEWELTVSFQGKLCRRVVVTEENRTVHIPVNLRSGSNMNGVYEWTPQTPNLYDMRIRLLCDGMEEDCVDTYFGMRKVELRNGCVYLNNHRIYQRLVLDQGYWPDTLLTPPSDEALRHDIELTLKMGFNGARKHQKVEDPRYYYWADRLGLLVWGELPSAYDFGEAALCNLTQALFDFIRRDYNHPSIIVWVPLNESWGVHEIATHSKQQAAANMLYSLTKAADGTRLCSSNDGWEQTRTDICALHDYAASGNTMAAHFADRSKVEALGCDVRRCFADGYAPVGQEVFMVTEYGGIAFDCIGLQGNLGGMETWGYHDKVSNVEQFLKRYSELTEAILALPYCGGYCYTQLTDVMQEVNGLLTPERKPKVDLMKIALINHDPYGVIEQKE